MPFKFFGSTGIFSMIEESIMRNQLLEWARDREREREEERKQEQEERDRQRHQLLQLERLAQEQEEEEQGKRKYPVVVIGCGASGLAALSKLQEAGIPAVGVEATGRIGGRINTVDFGDKLVDLGAQWCHGERNNKVFELASRHDLLEGPQSSRDPDWYVISDGSLMPTGNAKDVLNCIEKEIQQNKNDERSISEFIRTGVRSREIITSPGVVPITQPFIEWYERDQHLGCGDQKFKEKSLRALSKQEICQGEFYLNWKRRGFSTFLDVLLGKQPGETTELNVDIRYNKVVSNILWINPVPDPDDPVPTVVITFKDGTTMKASKVIVTVPLGVLKLNYLSMFTPPLPPNKIQAINELQYFVLDKIFIEFERAWWPEGMINFKILWREEDKALFQNEKWVTGIYGLRIVEHLGKVLMAWISGPLAEEMEKIRDDQLSRGILKLLQHVFSLNFDVPAVTRLSRSKWASNDFARGAFSYRAVSTENSSSASAEVLSEPLRFGSVPVVCFAGEATSHKWHGHVHGAVDTGYREAERVISSSAQEG